MTSKLTIVGEGVPDIALEILSLDMPDIKITEEQFRQLNLATKGAELAMRELSQAFAVDMVESDAFKMVLDELSEPTAIPDKRPYYRRFQKRKW